MNPHFIREPRTGRIAPDVDLEQLKSDDTVAIHVDDVQSATPWHIKIIAIDPMLSHRQTELWITGLYLNIRCRVLVRTRGDLPGKLGEVP